jgi:hypothetical protein
MFDLNRAMDTMRRTPAVLRAMLTGLDEEAVHRNYGPDTFSPFDVVGHLVYGERTNLLPRVNRILEDGMERAFEPFDRYAHFEESDGKTIGGLLDEFERLRAANLLALERMELTGDQLASEGIHPALGRVRLSELLATWAAHDLNHIAQIARGLAAVHQNAVGPWRAYLGIFKAPATPMDADGAARRNAAIERRKSASGSSETAG